MNKTCISKFITHNYAIIATIAMAIIVAIVVFCCHNSSSQPQTEKITTDSIVRIITPHSRLYTAETTSHTTIHYTSTNQLTFTLLNNPTNIDIPFSKTTADIPVSVTYKAYIDLSRVTKSNIILSGDTAIAILLPDPILVPTAITIDHDSETLHTEILASGIPDSTYQRLIVKAKQDAWTSLSSQDKRAIFDVARVSATDLLLPQLSSLGFRHIDIRYKTPIILSPKN